MSYLTEAFKQMELLESEQFTFDKAGVTKLANFLQDDMLDDFETIIDPEAETTEELKDSYIGDVICRCPICKSLIYRDPEAIKIDEEEQLANVEDPCPYCFEHGGFEIVGQVAPYEEVTVKATDDDIKVEIDGEKIEVESGEDEEEIKEEILEESLNEGTIYDKLVKAFPELEDNKDEIKSKRRHARDNEDIEDSQRFPVEGTNQINLVERRCAKKRFVRNNEDLEDSQRYPIESPVGTNGLKEGIESEEESNDEDVKEKLLSKRRHARDNEDLEDSQRYPIESPAPAQTGLREGMEDISITTDDTVIKVKATPREDKETIQPLTDTTISKIEDANKDELEDTTSIEDEYDEEVDIEEIDETSFDSLSERYLKEVYENVESFKTSSIYSKDNLILIEGIISFNSGKKAKTNFVFESKEVLKNGKLKFLGLNENITKNKKAFTLTGSVINNKLMLESLNYNYSAKTNDGKSKRLYGTLKNN